MTRFTLDDTLGDILDDPEGKAVLLSEFGDMMDSPMVTVLRPEPISNVLGMVELMISPEALDRLKRELLAE